MIQKVWNLPGNLEQVMGSMTNREYLMRLAWLEEYWRTPDRKDHYLMQIAQEIRRVLSKKPNKVKLKEFKIEFGTEEDLEKERQKQAESQGNRSKQAWLGILGRVKKDD